MTSQRLHPVMFRALWAYRGFVLGAVRREVESRYRGSLLGAAWIFLQPLAQILVFTLVFAEIMKPTLPGHEGSAFAYGIYLCSGILAWGLFSEILMRLTTVFLEHANLIKKSSFPRIALPAVVLGSALLNFVVIMMLFLGFLVLNRATPGLELLGLVPVVAIQVAFATGLGLLCGTLNVFFRDIGQLVSVVLGFWFWLTPIIYVEASLPARAKDLVGINPMTPIVHAYQRVFLDHGWPEFSSLLPVAGISVVLLGVAGAFFVRQAPDLVDEL